MHAVNLEGGGEKTLYLEYEEVSLGAFGGDTGIYELETRS